MYTSATSLAHIFRTRYWFENNETFIFLLFPFQTFMFRFVDLSRVQYTAKANDIQLPFIGINSSSKQCTGVYPAQLVGGRRPPSPQCIGATPPDAQAAVGVCWYIPAGDGHPRRSRPRRAHSRRQAVPPSALGRQRERSAQVIPGRSCFGSFLLVDHRLSSLCHFATNEPSANVM